MAEFLTRCKGCREYVRWSITSAGKRIPLDPEAHPDGNVQLLGDGSCRVLTREQIALEGGVGLLYRSHFATCEFAASFRSPK